MLMSPVKITGMMCINVTGEDYRYNVHQCHWWKLQVWFILMSPVNITSMFYINVTAKDYRYDLYQCHRWRLQVWCASMSPVKITCMIYVNVTGDHYRYNVHQCHRGRLQVWCASVSPGKITGMMYFYLCRWVNTLVCSISTCVAGEGYRYKACSPVSPVITTCTSHVSPLRITGMFYVSLCHQYLWIQ